MKKLLSILIIFLNILFADAINLRQGWNFIGLNNTINLSSDSTFNDQSKVKIVWKYINDDKLPSQGWHVYTSDTTLKQKAEDLGLHYSDTLSYYEGAWVYAIKDLTYTVASKNHSFTNSNIPLSDGWNFLSAVDNTNININENIFTTSKATYVYRDGEWYAKFSAGTSTTSSKILTSINSYEAFWIYKDPSSVNINAISVVKKGVDTTIDLLITAQCSTTNGVAIYTGADTNGNGILDISEYANVTPVVICDGATGVDGATIINPEISFEGARLQGIINPTSLGRKLYGYLGSPNRSLKLVPKAVSSMSKAKPYLTKIRANKHELLSHTFDVSVNSDGTYAVDDVPSGGDYSLVYVDTDGNLGKKIDDISLKPGETKTVNVDSLKSLGTATLKVQALSTNTNLVGAKVVVSELEKEFISNSSGDVTITNIPDGTYSLRIDKDAYVSKYVNFTVNFGQTESLGTLFLNSQKGILTGKVVIDGIDVPENIIVYAKAPDGSMFATLTDTGGNYTFGALAVADGYSVITTAHGYANGKVDNLNVTNGGNTTASNLTLNKLNSIASGSLRGFARFSDVTDMSHAGIIVSIEGTDYEAISARDGSFVINNIPAGVYNINFTESRYKTITSENLRVIAGATSSLFETTMTPNIGTLKGKIIDENGIVLSGVSISIVSELNSYTTTTDSSGIFNINVVSGTYTVTSIKTGYGNNQSSNIDIVYSTTKDIGSITLVSNTIVGTVDVESLSDNMTGVSVRLTNLSDSTYKDATWENGSFKFSAVKNGNYKLVITKDGTDFETTTLELYNVDEDGYLFTTPILLQRKSISKDYDMLTFNYIKGQNSSSSAVQYNLNLPTVMPNGSSVSWSSTVPGLVSNSGTVTLPDSTATNTLDLEATISYSGETDKTVTIPLIIIKDYQPAFLSSSVTINVDEDFGYLFKSVLATNSNGEAITYSITNIVNASLLDAMSIDPNSGEISMKSKAKANGVVTFNVVATCAGSTATQTVTLDIFPSANTLLGEEIVTTPGTTVTLNNLSISNTDISYSWVLTKPSNSNAIISNTSTSNPTFIPDVAGEYDVELTISNNLYSSTNSVKVYATTQISINDTTVSEGVDAQLTVTLSHPLSKDINISYKSNSITAKSDIDFKPLDATLLIVANTTTATINVPVYGDTTPEAIETLNITLSSSEKLITFQKNISTITIEKSSFNVSQLNGINGLVITGQDQSGYFGTSISGGDINNDGLDDLLIGANYAKDGDGDSTGVAYVIYASDDLTTQTQVSVGNIGSSWNSLSGVKFYPGGETSGDFGISVDIVKNNYGDSKIKLLVGASSLNSNGSVVSVREFMPYSGGNIDINGSTFDSFYYLDTLKGENSDDYFGKTSMGAGDINGDGVEDILIGAPSYDNTNSYSNGRAYLIFGTNGTTTPNTTIPPTSTSQGIMITGDNQYDNVGEYMSPVGDVNGDGYDDFIIGVPNADDGNITDVGKAYLYFGREYFNTTTNDLLDANITFKGSSQWDNFGRTISGLGDINGDGYSDFAIGSPWNENGELFVVLGKKDFNTTSINLNSTTFSDGFIITAESQNSGFGESVSCVRDINGDGYDDFLIGSPYKGENGRVYTIYGNSNFNSNSSFNVSALDGVNGFTIDGDESYVGFGSEVKGVGDVNGDGYKDFAIGAPYASLWSSYGVGKTYLIYGGDFTNNVT